MLYRLDAELPDLSSACASVMQRLPEIADAQSAVGPLLVWTGLSPSELGPLTSHLPGSDLELVLEGDDPTARGVLDRLFPLAPLDRVSFFFGDHAAMELRGGRTGSLRIGFACTGAPGVTSEIPEEIPHAEREAAFEALLQTARIPWIRLPEKQGEADVRVLHEGPEGRLFATRDELRLERSEGSQETPARLLVRLLEVLPARFGWRAKLAGDLPRAARHLAQHPGRCVEVNVGASAARRDELLALEYDTPELWLKRMRKEALTPVQLAHVLEAEPRISYREIVFRWMNLKAWVWNSAGERSPEDPEAFTDNAIEVSRMWGKPAKQYFSIGDWLPRRQIREALEDRWGARLKKLRW